MVSLWSGEGDATDLARGHDGTLVGGDSIVPGLVGRAFWLDETGEVLIPNNPDFNVQVFTFEAWVFPTALDGQIDLIINKEGLDVGGPVQYELGIKGPRNSSAGTIPQGNIAFAFAGVTGLPNNYAGWTDRGGPIPLNAWSHIAWTVEPGVTRIYINGVLAREYRGLAGRINTSTGPLRLGS